MSLYKSCSWIIKEWFSLVIVIVTKAHAIFILRERSTLSILSRFSARQENPCVIQNATDRLESSTYKTPILPRDLSHWDGLFPICQSNDWGHACLLFTTYTIAFHWIYAKRFQETKKWLCVDISHAVKKLFSFFSFLPNANALPILNEDFDHYDLYFP